MDAQSSVHLLHSLYANVLGRGVNVVVTGHLTRPDLTRYLQFLAIFLYRQGG